jgi:hypothetical protein
MSYPVPDGLIENGTVCHVGDVDRSSVIVPLGYAGHVVTAIPLSSKGEESLGVKFVRNFGLPVTPCACVGGLVH